MGSREARAADTQEAHGLEKARAFACRARDSVPRNVAHHERRAGRQKDAVVAGTTTLCRTCLWRCRWIGAASYQDCDQVGATWQREDRAARRFGALPLVGAGM